jgi:hypothetical protein
LTIAELEALRDEIAALVADMANLASRITQVFFGESKLITDFSDT